MILLKQSLFPVLIPIRREVARLALEKLISDGRIHPARIEEMVDKSRKEVEVQIREEGEQATFEAGVHGLHPELVKLLGRLEIQNQLWAECTEAFHRSGSFGKGHGC
jgi:uncharacterized protein HemY